MKNVSKFFVKIQKHTQYEWGSLEKKMKESRYNSGLFRAIRQEMDNGRRSRKLIGIVITCRGIPQRIHCRSDKLLVNRKRTSKRRSLYYPSIHRLPKLLHKQFRHIPPVWHLLDHIVSRSLHTISVEKHHIRWRNLLTCRRYWKKKKKKNDKYVESANTAFTVRVSEDGESLSDADILNWGFPAAAGVFLKFVRDVLRTPNHLPILNSSRKE